jgi:hypothetical protein
MQSRSPWFRVSRNARKVDAAEYEQSNTPKCSCGNIFPLDTHPVTGEKICAGCYKAAKPVDWIVDFTVQLTPELSEANYHFAVSASSAEEAEEKAQALLMQHEPHKWKFVRALTIEDFKVEVELWSGR